jgi:predicted alpha/beta-fold hydrolase
METGDLFTPPRILGGAYIQTVLASLKIRALGRNHMVRTSRRMILQVGCGVRLEGFLSEATGAARGLVVLIHGWEGSAGSTYILHTGRFFFSRGYSVFRLNLRDHGDTHHLNEGVFMADRIDEVFQAVRSVAGLAPGLPSFLVGFSLGGNFALRIAGRCVGEPVQTLRHIVAVSPVIDPSHATDAIDRSPLLRGYFRRKWRRSLLRKQALFPHLYDFSPVVKMRTIRSMTDAVFSLYDTGYDAESYFRAYSVQPGTLEAVDVPTLIVASRDDPVIPCRDFDRLRLSPCVRLVMHDSGGHNGFLEGVFAPTWYERKALGRFSACNAP